MSRNANERLRDRLQAFVRERWDDLTWQETELLEDVDLALVTASHATCDEQIAALTDEIVELEFQLAKALEDRRSASAEPSSGTEGPGVAAPGDDGPVGAPTPAVDLSPSVPPIFAASPTDVRGG